VYSTKGKEHMMKRLAVLVLPLALAAACGDDDNTPADAAVDAAPVVDATPEIDVFTGPLYPPGPYGMTALTVIADEQFLGYCPDSAGDLVSDNEARVFWLHEFYKGNDPSIKVIMINIGAVWCYWCNLEAEHLQVLADDYYADGVRFATVVAQNNDGDPSAREDAQAWAEKYLNEFPTLADPDGVIMGYVDQDAFPANVFIWAHNMEIFAITTGGDDDPDLVAFRNIIDYMVQNAPQ
jgi:thiol-disulfide isomerase/thioredoxin